MSKRIMDIECQFFYDNYHEFRTILYLPSIHPYYGKEEINWAKDNTSLGVTSFCEHRWYKRRKWWAITFYCKSTGWVVTPDIVQEITLKARWELLEVLIQNERRKNG